MRTDDVKKFQRQRPFRPFRLALTNGTTYEVHHPEMIIVGLSTLNVGIPDPNEPEDVYDRLVTISLSHVMEIEPLKASTSRDSAS